MNTIKCIILCALMGSHFADGAQSTKIIEKTSSIAKSSKIKDLLSELPTMPWQVGQRVVYEITTTHSSTKVESYEASISIVGLKGKYLWKEVVVKPLHNKKQKRIRVKILTAAPRSTVLSNLLETFAVLKSPEKAQSIILQVGESPPLQLNQATIKTFSSVLKQAGKSIQRALKFLEANHPVKTTKEKVVFAKKSIIATAITVRREAAILHIAKNIPFSGLLKFSQTPKKGPRIAVTLKHYQLKGATTQIVGKPFSFQIKLPPMPR